MLILQYYTNLQVFQLGTLRDEGSYLNVPPTANYIFEMASRILLINFDTLVYGPFRLLSIMPLGNGILPTCYAILFNLFIFELYYRCKGIAVWLSLKTFEGNYFVTSL